MNLSPKLKRDINKILSDLYPTSEDIGAFIKRAGLQIGRFNLAKAPRESWPCIIDDSEENEMIPSLVETACGDHGGNAELSRILDEMNNGNKTRLKKIAKAIKTGQCILFLGPGVLQTYKADGLLSFNQCFANELLIKLNTGNIFYEEKLKKDLKYIVQRYETFDHYIKGEVGTKAKEYFESIKNSVLKLPYENLSKLPFPLVINTNPDTILSETINTILPDSSGGTFYKFNNDLTETEVVEDLSKYKTIEYNIFGSFKRPQSILYTEADFVRFSKHILEKNPPIPKEVNKCFDETKSYLFLGFEFSLWHLKILLEALNIERIEDRGISIYIDKPLPHHDLEYFDKEFKFYFFNSDVTTFTNTLLSEFNKL